MRNSLAPPLALIKIQDIFFFSFSKENKRRKKEEKTFKENIFESTYNGATDPGRDDIGTGSKDIENSAVVGKGRSVVVDICCSDGTDTGLGGGGGILSIAVAVAGSDGDEDTGADQSRGRLVDGSRIATSQAHRGYDTPRATTAFGVLGNIVHASNDGGVRAGARVIEDLDTVELGLLGNTIRLAADGTGAVGSVAVAVRILAGDEALEERSTALELLVACLNASVDDVGAGAGTGTVVVSVVGVAGCAVGDASKTPGRSRLINKGIDMHQSIFFDVFNLVGFVRNKAECIRGRKGNGFSFI